MGLPSIASERRHSPTVTWFELFYDLVVVAAVTLTNDAFLDEPSITTARAAVFGIVALSWIWFHTTLFNNMFPGQDLLRRLLLLGQMALIVTAGLAVDQLGGPDRRTAMLAYSGALLVLVVLMASTPLLAPPRVSSPVAEIRAWVWALAGAVVCAVGAFVPVVEAGWFLAAALAITIVPTLTWQYRRWIGDARLRPDHLRERLGLFVLIILGEGFAQLVVALHGAGGIPRAGLYALTFLVSYALWWIYFDGTFSERLDLDRVHWRLSLLGHLTLVFGMAGTLDILVLVTAQKEAEFGPQVLRYFAVCVALVLLSFALLRYTARGELGIPGWVNIASAVLVVVAGLVTDAEGFDPFAVVAGYALVVIGNGVMAAWADRTVRSGGMRSQVSSVLRGADG